MLENTELLDISNVKMISCPSVIKKSGERKLVRVTRCKHTTVEYQNGQTAAPWRRNKNIFLNFNI